MTHPPCRRPRLPANRTAAVLHAGLFTIALALPWFAGSCSRGHNSLLNPGTNREGLEALPETLIVGAPSADRGTRVQVTTGPLDTLTLARTDSVETIIFLRFGALPDTVGITQALLALRIHAPAGSNLRIDAYAVDSTSTWSESGIRWANRPELVEYLSTSTAIAPAPSDTARYPLYPGAVVLPGEAVRWIQSWKRNPNLGGLALKISDSSPAGELRILSREAAVYDSIGATVLNPRLRMIKGLGYDDLDDRAPTADALVYHDLRPPIAGDAPLLVAQWLPTRALFRFNLTPLLSLLPPGVAVNRARLFLTVESYAVQDTFQLAVSQAIGPWDETSEPDTLGSGGISDLVSIPKDIGGATETIAMDVGPIVRQQIVPGPGGVSLAGDSLNLMIRIIGEGRSPRRMRFYSREADDPGMRPYLELIYTAPPVPRWNSAEAVQ